MALKLTQNSTGKTWSSGSKKEEKKEERQKTTGASAPVEEKYSSPSGKLTLTRTSTSTSTPADDPNLLERIGKTLSGTGRRQVSGYAGAAENLMENIRRLDSLNSAEHRKAQQEQENAAHYREMLARGTMDDGTVIDAAQRARLEMLLTGAENRAKVYQQSNEAIHQPISGLIEKTDAYGDRVGAASEADFQRAKQGAGVVGRTLVDAGSALTDVLADAAANVVLPGLGTAGRVARSYGHGAEAAEGKGFDLAQQNLYGGGSAALGELANRMFSSNPILQKAFGSGALDDILLPGLEKSLPGSIVKSAFGEALEEGGENIGDYFLQRAIMGDQADEFSWKDVGYDALIGGLVGGVTGVSRGRGSQNLQNQETDSQESQNRATDAAPARSLPPAEGNSMGKTENVSEGLKTASADTEAKQQPLPSPADRRASVMETAKKTLGKEGYRMFEAAYRDSDDPATSYSELTRAYNDGLVNRKTGSRVLSEGQYESMFEAGRADAAANVAAQSKLAAKETTFSRKDSGIDYSDAVTSEYVKGVDRKTVKVIDTVAKTLGLKVRFADSVDGGSANAQIQSGIITIEKNNPNPLRSIFGHEITHRMQDLAPTEYAKLREVVAKNGGVNSAIQMEQAKYAQHGRTIGNEAALDEAVADYVGRLMEDEGELERFIQKYGHERTLLEKLRDIVRELKVKLRGTETEKQLLAVEKRLSKTLDAAAKQTKTNSKNGNVNVNADVNVNVRNSIKSLSSAAGMDAVRTPDGKVEFHIDGKAVREVTADHIKNHSGIGALIKTAQTYGNISDADAKIQYQAAADIMNMIIKTQDPDMVWAWVGSSMFSAVKSNSDGQYGTTIDFTTVCRKTQDMITAMSRAMMKLKRGLSKDEVTQLQKELIGEGSSVPCPVCYVFSRWAGIGSILDNMNRWQNRYDGYTDAQVNRRIVELSEKLGKGKAKDLAKMLREQDEQYDQLSFEKEKLTLEKKQLNAKQKTAIRENDTRTLMEIQSRLEQIAQRMPQINQKLKEIKASVAPELAWLLQVRSQPDYAEHGRVPAQVLFNLDDAVTFAEKYSLAWKYRTTRGPSAGKAILPYSDMRLGDMILGVGNTSADGNKLFAQVGGEFTDAQKAAVDKAVARTKAQNLIGGQRFQSTSDFRYDYALDYLMAFWECQALGSKLQTYTKIVEFSDMVAAVGGDVNLSVMPRNKGYVTLPDGTKQLIFSSVTGIDFEAAKQSNALHDNAQLILVGINDEHIRAALEDSEATGGSHIGFVIPYHASGASINEFVRVLVSNLGETYMAKSYQDYSDVQGDKERSNATAAQKRRNDLRTKLLRGKDGGKNWEPSEEDLAFIRGESVDISQRSFEDLRTVEQKALRGDKAAIAEYESWTAGALWDLYNKMWVEGGAEEGVRLNTAQAKAVMPHEYWNKTVNRDRAYINGFLFRSYCYNLGLTPRFSGAVVKGEKHGDFTDSKGYWKTLIDRPMYRNDGTYRDQQAVNVTGFQKEMLSPSYAKENWGEYAVQEPSAERANRAADKFVGNARLSLKDSDSVMAEIARIQKEARKNKQSDVEVQAAIRSVVEEAYAGMVEEYGAIDPGERAARDVQVPKKTGKGKKVSQTVRTAMEAAATPDEALPDIQKLIATGEFSYDVYTDKQAIADASSTIESVGWAQALADWTKQVKNGEVSKKNTAMGWALYNNAVNSGDTKTALTVLDYMIQHQRNAAQALQATRILKKLSPETQLYQIQRSVENLQEELNKRYGDKKAPKIVIPQELADRYRKAQTQEERDEVMKDIYRDVGRQMPSRFIDKWNAWRYLAMLGNPRTHVRNVVGNAGFAPIVATKNATATFIEWAVNGVSHGKLNRSKSMVGFSKADRALLKAAWADFAKVEDIIMGSGKYSDAANPNQYIEEGRQIFKFKPLEAARKGNTSAMNVEDKWFSRPHYAAALASYCKQHGLSPEQIQRGKETKNARTYAIREAQKATYRDTNALSQTISELGRPSADETNPVKKGVGVVMEGILPFRKTPANILARGLEYSPMGLLNGIKQAVWDVKRGKKTGAEAIDSIAAGLTGTGLLRLGMYLAAQGLVRGHGSDDEDENEFKELMGHQAYALEIGNESYTLDWLAPEALPFFVGVNLWEQTRGSDEEVTLSAMLNAVKTVTEPLLEMSCLQSLNDVFDSVGYATSDGLDGLPAALASAATSYLTQGLPTILGQAERTGEDVRMTTYTEKNAFLTGDMQYTLGKASARIPKWEYQQIPYIDAWGRTESSGSTGERAVNNFLNPAYTSEIQTSAMENELLRLYEKTGESKILPSRAAKYFNVYNKVTEQSERKDLTAEEYVKYAQKKGQTSYSLLTGLTANSAYKGMDSADQVDAISKCYEYANAVAKASISSYKPDGWVAKAISASSTTGIKAEQYVTLYIQQGKIESMKNAKGDTIDNSKGLLIMQMIYNTPGLTEKQRQQLFLDFGVGKTVRGYNKALVDQKLKIMKQMAK